MPFLNCPLRPESIRLLLAGGVEQGLAQRVVDDRLIAEPLMFRSRTRRFDYRVIQHDGDAGLAFVGRHCAAFARGKVIFVSQGSSLLKTGTSLAWCGEACRNDSNDIMHTLYV